MTRACATLTLFLGLPQGTMGFASSFSACRLQASAAPRTALLRACRVWGRTSSSSSSERQPLRHLRRRRSEGLVASLSTKGEREVNPATEEAQLLQQPSSVPESQRRHQQQPQQPRSKRGTTRKRLTSTGGLKSLPIVTPSIELLSHASRRSKKVSQVRLGHRC
ncbi:unnamed protein product [Ectocarpus sp. 8 AP-2014]